MTLRSSDGREGESARLIFIGSEESCISFVREAKWDTLRPEFKAAYKSAYNLLWRALKPSIIYCTISAGRNGVNRVEKSFTVNLIK